MITDKRGKVPNYLYQMGDLWLVHQPTGLKVKCASGSDASLRLAHAALKRLVEDGSDASVDALDTGARVVGQATAPEGS